MILRLLFTTLVLLGSPHLLADSISPLRREAKLLENGQLSISTRFQTELPEQLRTALKQGVALDFILTYQLDKPTFASYRHRISNWVSSHDTVNYRLSYHPITGRYRISVGTFSTEYNSLETALKGVGAIANWQVLNEGTLKDVSKQNVAASVRLSLSTSKLPKPFQINALTSRNWALDSGWKDLTIQQ